MRAPIALWAVMLIVPVASQAQAQQAASPSVGPIGISIAPFTYAPLPDPGFTMAQEKGKEKEKEKEKGKEKGTEKEKGKDKPPVEPKQQPVEDAFAPEPDRGAEASRGFNPHMIGDLPGAFSLQTVMLPATQIIKTFQFTTSFVSVQQLNANGTVTTRQVPVTTQTPVTFQRVVLAPVVERVPLASVGSSKIGENQSPMPENRAYMTYNFYNDVTGPAGPAGTPQQTTFNGAPATVTTLTPNSPRIDIQRGVFGLEKTFLDGNASVGVRVPIFGAHGDGFSQSDLGDVSVFLNYAFYRDAAGNVLSGGLAVTLPTGPDVNTIDGNVHPFLLQPFVGYRRNLADFYVQGFTSVEVPTDAREATVLYNDVGFGYWLYRGNGDRLITALIPTFEVHVTTPLNQRGPNALISVPDIVDFTGGIHIGIGSRSLLTFGVVTPVTGPRLWSVEAIAQLNIRF